ncbi:hypothetical protein M0802_014724 [Mischocyttarus mexicanus]|nr:hypothetical protein M0802_014724 [Mischocyttarus mexicanus]
MCLCFLSFGIALLLIAKSIRSLFGLWLRSKSQAVLNLVRLPFDPESKKALTSAKPTAKVKLKSKADLTLKRLLIDPESVLWLRSKYKAFLTLVRLLIDTESDPWNRILAYGIASRPIGSLLSL